jgi:hypothetical protein
VSPRVTTEAASTRIAEFAFRYAERENRPRVTMVHKANILNARASKKNKRRLSFECRAALGALAFRQIERADFFDVKVRRRSAVLTVGEEPRISNGTSHHRSELR